MALQDPRSGGSVMDDLFGDDSDVEEEHVHSVDRFIALSEARSCGPNQIGLFATDDLPPGTLVLAEIPILTWKRNVTFSSIEDILRCIRGILSSAEAKICASHLFPRQLNHVGAEEIAEVETLLVDSQTVVTKLITRLGVDRNEIIRLVLVLQHNGFESGLYRYLTILNHSCRPNCIKYAPSSSSFGASEIWTTEWVKKGDELFICYVEPNGQNPVSVRSYLWKNHRFECNCRRCLQPCSAMNVVATELVEPVADVDADPDAQVHSGRQFNSRIEDWQSIVDEMETELVSWQKQVTLHKSVVSSGNTEALVSMPIRDSDIVGLHSVILEGLQLRDDIKQSCNSELMQV